MRPLVLALLLCAGCEEGPADAGDAFADAVVSVTFGDQGGFHEEQLPDVVLGPPEGRGATAGSTDVVSLGRGGEIVLEFTDQLVVDGNGPDLLVFENAFKGWIETGEVSVSDDGEVWHTWDCNPDTFAGCAGVEAVFAHPNNDLDPTDPDQAGGDAFDLAELGLDRARYVRIVDTGNNDYPENNVGGFDLDAVAAVHRTPARP